MSIRSLTSLAVERDIAPPGQLAKGGAGGAGGGAIPQQFTDAITSAIPTEPLAAYTAVVGVVAGVTTGDSYLPFRWAALAAFLVVIAAAVYVSYLTKATLGPRSLKEGNRRTFPAIELASALIAGLAWGLAMPGSALNVALKGNAATIAAASIAIGGAAVLSLLTPWLTKASKTPGQVEAGMADREGTGGQAPDGGGQNPPPPPPPAPPPPPPSAPAPAPAPAESGGGGPGW
jgi:hypothetical protein